MWWSYKNLSCFFFVGPGRPRSAPTAQGMDMDGNGHLSLEEMLDGYDHNPEFKNLMQQMEIGRFFPWERPDVVAGKTDMGTGRHSLIFFCEWLNS